MQDIVTHYPALAAMPPVQWPVEIFAFDGETTGLKPERHGMLEIAAIHPASGESWNALIDPRPCDIDPAALEKNGYTLAMLDEPGRLTPMAATFWFAQWCRARMGEGKRAILCGRNPSFDLGFLDEAARALVDKEREIYEATFSHQKADTHGGVIPWAIAHRIPLDQGLKYAYRSIGIPDEPKPHRAIRGALHAFAGLSMLVCSHLPRLAPAGAGLERGRT